MAWRNQLCGYMQYICILYTCKYIVIFVVSQCLFFSYCCISCCQSTPERCNAYPMDTGLLEVQGGLITKTKRTYSCSGKREPSHGHLLKFEFFQQHLNETKQQQITFPNSGLAICGLDVGFEEFVSATFVRVATFLFSQFCVSEGITNSLSSPPLPLMTISRGNPPIPQESAAPAPFTAT